MTRVEDLSRAANCAGDVILTVFDMLSYGSGFVKDAMEWKEADLRIGLDLE
jgi:hypothetical protein